MNHTWLSLCKGDVIMVAPGKEQYKDDISSWFGYIPASDIIEDQAAPPESPSQIRVISQLNRDEIKDYAILVLDEPFKRYRDSTRVRMNVLIDGRVVQLISMKGNIKDWIKLG